MKSKLIEDEDIDPSTGQQSTRTSESEEYRPNQGSSSSLFSFGGDGNHGSIFDSLQKGIMN
jgi:hypothetical protein